jgi:hypothetical protein
MHNHFVMFRLKPEFKKDLPEVVARLKGLEKKVPAIRKLRVYVNNVWGPHSYDLMFYIQVDNEKAFKEDYMLHPEHVPVQKYIEARVAAIADTDVSD